MLQSCMKAFFLQCTKSTANIGILCRITSIYILETTWNIVQYYLYTECDWTVHFVVCDEQKIFISNFGSHLPIDPQSGLKRNIVLCCCRCPWTGIWDFVSEVGYDHKLAKRYTTGVRCKKHMRDDCSFFQAQYDAAYDDKLVKIPLVWWYFFYWRWKLRHLSMRFLHVQLTSKFPVLICEPFCSNRQHVSCLCKQKFVAELFN